MHLNLLSELNLIMCINPLSGFVTIREDGTAVATALVSSETTASRMATVQATKVKLLNGPACNIDSSIQLAWACLKALPKIITGQHTSRSMPVTELMTTPCEAYFFAFTTNQLA